MPPIFDSLSSHTISLLALLIPIVIAIVPVIIKTISKRRAFLLWRQAEMDNKFNPQFDDNEQTVLKLITSRFFIPIHGQTTAPHNGDIEDDSKRVDLIKTLINDILSGKGKMRYLVMGGSGMGKSTFSAALFHTYIFRYRFKKPPFPIFVQYLGDERSIDIIKRIVSENQSTIHSSILILDAFDENRDAALDRLDFWNNINRITHDFKVVIITCRPQFFENEESEPAESSIWVNSPNGLISYKKYYISPISENDVQSYLQAKYRIESEDYRRAKLISDKCKDLSIRPMVLAFIDELKDFKGHSIPNIAELYCQIIESWLKRECRHLPKSNQEEWKAILFTFSKELAFRIYSIWKTFGRSYLTDNEFQLFLAEKGYQTSPYSYKERSLVNRTSEGYIKFAHKSFLEFFIAVLAFERPGLMISPYHWDFARAFYNAIYELDIKGEKFGFIDYYIPHLFKTSDFSNIDNYTSISLQDWWMINILHAPTVFSICREAERDGFIQMMGLDIEVVNRVFDARYGIEKTLPNVQTMLIEESIKHTTLNVSEEIEDVFSSYAQQQSLSFLPSSFGLKETLIMPNLFELDKDIFDVHLRNSYINLISVGCGINDSSAIYNTIAYLHKANLCPDIISVYREGDDLDEHIGFIQGLNSVEDRPHFIILCIIYHQVQLFFIHHDSLGSLDDNTIRSILLNQINDGEESCAELYFHPGHKTLDNQS